MVSSGWYSAVSFFDDRCVIGPPSQSLGVDPVDPAVMRKPPRRKNEPIITRRFLYRVLFSASTIVFGTLFIYYIALVGDEQMSRREQTMVRHTLDCFAFETKANVRRLPALCSSILCLLSRTAVLVADYSKTRCWSLRCPRRCWCCSRWSMCRLCRWSSRRRPSRVET